MNPMLCGLWALVLLVLHFGFANCDEIEVDAEVVVPEIVNRVKIDVEHSVGGHDFSFRNSFYYQVDSEGKKSIADVEKFAVKDDLYESFKDLLATNGYYKIRMRVSGSKSKQFAQAALPACNLQKSGFKEDVALYIKDDLNIVSISYKSPLVGLPRACDPRALKNPQLFLTRIKLGDEVKSMDIPLAATAAGKPHYLSHMTNLDQPQTKIDPKTGKSVPVPPKEPPQSFIQRYWYIGVCILLYMMLGKDDPPPKKKKAEAASAAAPATAPADQ